MTVRKANIEDINPLAQLFDAYRMFYHQKSDLEAAIAFLKDRILLKESVIFLVIDEQDKYAGFTQLYPIFTSVGLRRKWLLNDLFVAPEFRRKGISKLLIDAAKKLCKEQNAQGLILETAKNNEIGNQLYPKCDFVLDELYNVYYWNNAI